MAFLHSLVKTQENGRKGWCAPVELGEAAPHYVSFVVPVDDARGFFDDYICETVTTGQADRRTESHELVRQGDDSFVLRLGKLEVWFTVRAASPKEQRLPYVGQLEHEDFRYSFTEIEPEEPAMLDRLYEDEGTFIIGCEPFTHYSGLRNVERGR